MSALKNSLPGAIEDEEPDEGGGEVVGNCIPIPSGTYEVRYMYYSTGYFKDQAKVTVHFAIVEPEDYAGTPLERFYNVESLVGPPKRYGNYRAKARGSLNREVGMLLGAISRLDRISFAKLRGKRIICDVETVKKDGDRRPLPKDQYYSCIRRFVQVLEDDW